VRRGRVGAGALRRRQGGGMTTPQDDLAAIKAALNAGPTPGPWATGSSGLVHAPAGVHVCPFPARAHSSGNAAYIAACSPDRIARIVAHVERLESPVVLSEWQQAMRRIAELEAALSRYGEHEVCCDQHPEFGRLESDCSCGFAAAALEGKE
jgi:hypothetical protein